MSRERKPNYEADALRESLTTANLELDAFRAYFAILDKQGSVVVKPLQHAYVTCSCGKEWQTRARRENESDALWAAWVRLAADSLCASCSQVFGWYRDMCPEAISDEHGVSACSLPFRHKGRCEPFMSRIELEGLLAARRAAVSSEGTTEGK